MSEKNQKRGKNKLAFPIGIIILILAVIGAVSTVRFVSDSVKKMTDNTVDKLKYEQMLEPVVMFDPEPFDDLNQADVSQLLNSAVWALLMSEEGTEKYPYSEGDVFGIIVPQEDIEKYFVSLFGTEIDIASMHASVDMSAFDITYDAALKSYILPITGVESAYTPKVYEIEKKGSSVILSVGYIGSKAWAQAADEGYEAPEPDKYMKITLRERNGGMYIASIQAVDGQEIIGSMPSTRPPEVETVSETLPVLTQPEIQTSAVAVTDENGEEVTDESGVAVTEIVTVVPEITTGEELTTEGVTEESTTEEE
ncbi:MAG: hypothetical protein IKB88_04285 [Clostridia bacterium]|nr:hypothetical protein [Clostridia bacterium]